MTLARGISVLMPLNWEVIRDKEEESDSTYWISLKSGEVSAEISAYSLGKISPSEAISNLKFNTLELILSLGFSVLDHNSNYPHELLFKDSHAKGLVFYQYRPSQPIVLMTARGLDESQIQDLRLIFNSIETDTATLLLGMKLDSHSLVPFNWS